MSVSIGSAADGFSSGREEGGGDSARDNNIHCIIILKSKLMFFTEELGVLRSIRKKNKMEVNENVSFRSSFDSSSLCVCTVVKVSKVN